MEITHLSWPRFIKNLTQKRKFQKFLESDNYSQEQKQVKQLSTAYKPTNNSFYRIPYLIIFPESNPFLC